MVTAQTILSLAEAYAAAAGVTLTTVSYRVFEDSKKLAAIRDEGADLTLKRFTAALQWFSDNWPDTAWPEAIERPAQTPREPVKEAAE